jgi:hypothetical protein
VVVTPEGLAMTPPEAQLLPPVTQLSVQTWADFSRRLPPEYDPLAQGVRPGRRWGRVLQEQTVSHLGFVLLLML